MKNKEKLGRRTVLQSATGIAVGGGVYRVGSQTVKASGEGTIEFAELPEGAQNAFKSAVKEGRYQTYNQLHPVFYEYSGVAYRNETYALNVRFHHQPVNELVVRKTTEPDDTGPFNVREFDSLPAVGKNVFRKARGADRAKVPEEHAWVFDLSDRYVKKGATFYQIQIQHFDRILSVVEPEVVR